MNNNNNLSPEDISKWIMTKIAESSNTNLNEINAEASFADYGFDSLRAVSLTGELGEWLQMEIDPTIMWDHSTIKSLAEFLSTELNSKNNE